MESDNATRILGKASKAPSTTLVQYQEWHNQARDQFDSGSIYTLLASLESTVHASSVDLGLE